MKNFYAVIAGLFLLMLTCPINAQVNETDSLALVDFYNATGANWSDTWLVKPVAEWDGVVVSEVDGENRVTEISLEGINKDGVYPSGTIPSTIGNLSALSILKLIGVEKGDDTSITYPIVIDLHGSIPSTIWNLTSLTRLQIKFTHLTGGLPAISNPEKLTELYEVNFQQSYLGGEIPAEIFELPALTKAYLHESGFTGEVPSTLSQATNLVRLYFQGNELEGDLPYVDLTGNEAKIQLTGNYFTPSSVSAYNTNKSSYKGYTNDYQFVQDTVTTTLSSGSATLTDAMVNGSSYVWFKDESPLDNDEAEPVSGEESATYTVSATGTYTCLSYGTDVSDLPYYTVFNVLAEGSSTTVEDEFSLTTDSLALVDFYNATGANWSSTWLVNPIAEWDGVVVSEVDGVNRVTEISLEGINKDGVYPSGTIPTTIGDLSALSILKLIGVEKGDDTSITYPIVIDLHGSIPSTVWNLTSLTRLQIKFTHLTGGIPEISHPENLTALYEINFQQSYLGGEIPEELFELPALTKAYLHESGFTGTVPSTLSDATNLVRLYFQGNELEGDLPYVDITANEAKVEFTGNYFSPSSMAAYYNNKSSYKGYTNDYQFVEDTVSYTLTTGDSQVLTDNMVNGSSYAWFKGESPLDNDEAEPFTDGSSTYTISSFSSDDAGIYTCLSYGTDVSDIPYYTVYLVNVDAEGQTTGIENEEANGFGVSVSPNPFSNEINIDTDAEIKSVAVYNCVGKLVYQNTYGGASNVTVETADYANGLYIVRVVTSNAIITKKMIKK